MRYPIPFAVALAACADQGASAPVGVVTPHLCEFTTINDHDEPVDVAGQRSVNDVVSEAATLYASVHGVVYKEPIHPTAGNPTSATEPGAALTYSLGVTFGDIVSAKAVDDPFCGTNGSQLEVTIMASSTGDFVAGPIEATILANDQGMTLLRFGALGVPVGPIADAVEADGLSDVSTFGLGVDTDDWGTWVGPSSGVAYRFEMETMSAAGLVTGGGSIVYAWCQWPDTCLTADGVDAPWETTP